MWLVTSCNDDVDPLVIPKEEKEREGEDWTGTLSICVHAKARIAMASKTITDGKT